MRHALSPTDVANSAIQRAVLSIDRRHPGNRFALGSVGLSLETRELATPDLSASHTSLVALMRLLGPGVLRVGGDSLDYSWWSASHEPAPGWATNVVAPADLVRLRGLLAATGWRVILGVDLGHFDPARAANETQVAQHILGPLLLGFEIGNEPSNYANPVIGLRPRSYNANEYLTELAAYSAAMTTSTSTARLYGPDVGGISPQAWLLPISSNAGRSFAEIDAHYYPTKYNFSKGACRATPIPTALELLSPEVRQREDAELLAMSRAGELAHRRVRISETNNTSSCDAPGGPATSPVFASALWSFDWALRAESAGVAGVNFHGNFGYCAAEAFAPICEPANPSAALGRVVARPEYYGLLAARQLEGGRFLPTRLIYPGVLPNLMSWATVTRRGTITIAVENLAAEGPAQPISIPISRYTATYYTLAGPSIEARSGVTLGHADVTTTGHWRPRHTRLSRVGRSFRIVVRPNNAVIVTLHPKR